MIVSRSRCDQTGRRSVRAIGLVRDRRPVWRPAGAPRPRAVRARQRSSPTHRRRRDEPRRQRPRTDQLAESHGAEPKPLPARRSRRRVAVAGHLLALARAGCTAVRRPRRHDRRVGDGVHRRGDEADEPPEGRASAARSSPSTVENGVAVQKGQALFAIVPHRVGGVKPATRIRRVLVANRGEIAVRIVRACRDERHRRHRGGQRRRPGFTRGTAGDRRRPHRAAEPGPELPACRADRRRRAPHRAATRCIPATASCRSGRSWPRRALRTG